MLFLSGSVDYRKKRPGSSRTVPLRSLVGRGKHCYSGLLSSPHCADSKHLSFVISRKREQYDEMEIQVNALQAENAQLRSLLDPAQASALLPANAVSSSSSSDSSPSKPSTSTAIVPAMSAVDSHLISSLQSDLAATRSLLHASMSREAALSVELASLRVQRSSVSTYGQQQSYGANAGTHAYGLTDNVQQPYRNRAHIEDQERQMLALGGKRDRDGKKVGGVALMVSHDVTRRG